MSRQCPAVSRVAGLERRIMAGKRKATLGTVERNRNKWRAYYDHNGLRHTPGHTFSTEALAWGWLRAEQLLIDRDEWTPPTERRAAAEAEAEVNALTLDEYAKRWIAERRKGGRELRPRTVEHYHDLLDRWIAPLASRPVVALTRAEVSAWYLALPDKATMRSHAYDLLHSVLSSAVRDGLIERNPCDIPGATSKPKPSKVIVPTADEVAQLADAMPAQHRLAVLLAAWCGLRFGEVSALRRSDFEAGKDGAPMVLHVRRGVVRVGNTYMEGPTKSDAGVRDVVIPPHIVDDVKAHLRTYARWGADGLVFPPSAGSSSEFLTEGQLMGHKAKLNKDGTVREPGTGFRGARESIGREDLSFHKLRHHAATNYAIAGATTKELLDVMGHSDLNVALRYQHTAQGRAAELAARMSALAELSTMEGGAK